MTPVQPEGQHPDQRGDHGLVTDTPPPDPLAAVRPGSREYTPVIHQRLRTDILHGRRPPGEAISQAGVAAEFGVSRGPVREAFRQLESEGLIEAQLNHRARVACLSITDLEHVYTLRVTNESLALAVSVPAFTAHELDELDTLAEQLVRIHARQVGFDDWDRIHQRFHMLLLAHSGERMQATAAAWADHTQRYRRAYVDEAGGWTHGAAEHATLARHCRDRDPDAAAKLLARHLSRAALTLIASMDPTHDPVLLRSAVRQVTGPDPAPRQSSVGGGR